VPVQLGQMRRAVWYKGAYEIVNDAYIETNLLLQEAQRGWESTIRMNTALVEDMEKQDRFYTWVIPIGTAVSLVIGFIFGQLI
jgi:hypothetical protein